MSLKLRTEVQKVRDLPLLERAVLTFLADLAGRDGVATPDVWWIAAEVGNDVSEARVRKALKSLEAAGLVASAPGGRRADKTKRPTRYHVLPHGIPTAAARSTASALEGAPSGQA